MENRGLLFIPDISGFTRFVTEMEIEHSRHIIQELLEILIDANQIGLEVSEVEGDAILFYRFGESPDLGEIYKQVAKMFFDFHGHLQAYDYRRFCQCKACVSAINLSLKVITHYGEFTGYNVKNFNKLIGKDVIVAHQLLKNNIEEHEYWLVTKNVLNDHDPKGFTEWMKWDSSIKQTETGEIPFHYTRLAQLKGEIPPLSAPSYELPDKVKMFSVTREYDVEIKALFFTTVHFELRPRWQQWVKTIDEVQHFLPGVGTKHRALAENGQSIIYTSSFFYNPDSRVMFSETEENKKSAVYYIMEKLGENRSRLTIEFYLRNNLPQKLLFSLTTKKKMEAEYNQALVNLEGLLKEIELPVEF